VERILILDDDAAILSYLRVFFLQLGRHEVRTLQESPRALAAIEEFRPDLLLLDIDMPQLTGVDVLRALQGHAARPEVLAFSGVEDVKLAVEAMKLGAYDYLTKPLETEKLVAAVDRALERRTLKRQVEALQQRLAGAGEPSPFARIVTRSPKMLEVFRRVEVGGPHLEPGAGVGRVGHRQGAGGAGRHTLSPRARAAVRGGQRRGLRRRAVRLGVLRPRQGRLHRGDEREERPHRDLRRRDALLDEIGDAVAAGPGQAPARAAGGRVQPGGLHREPPGGRAPGDGHQQGPARGDPEGRLPRGPLLPAQRLLHLPAAAARARRRRRRPAGAVLPRALRPQHVKAVSGVSEEVRALLRRYPFPGNVRELENLVNSAVLLEQGPELTPSSLPQYFLEATHEKVRGPLGPPEGCEGEVDWSLERMEAEHVGRLLRYANGNRTVAARLLGISRVTLLAKIRAYKLE
jgi:FixJ family two-component response regulator